MGSDPLVWFCRPVANGVWPQEKDCAFGAYTPCAIGRIVGDVSNLVLGGLCLYRIWLIKIIPRLKRFCLRSKFFNHILALLASCCAAEFVFRLVVAVSIFNLDAETGLHPFEACTIFVCLFSLLPGYTPLPAEHIDDSKNEISFGEDVCPERNSNIFRRIYFDWVTPLMQKGFSKPITEKYVWKLDSWDRTETEYKALNRSLGGRFWFGGMLKIGNDLSQLSGSVLLNHLLKSLEQGDPAWVGYMLNFQFLLVWTLVTCSVNLKYCAY